MQNKSDGVAFNRKVNVVDRETGKSVYNNSDVVDMATFSIKRAGTGFQWNKIDYASIALRCTNCGHLNNRFLHQRSGFWCYKCNTMSVGIDLKLTNEESNKIHSCEKGSSRADDQSDCVRSIIGDRLNKHNNKYKYLPNGEPTFVHKFYYKMKPFIKGQVQLFKDLFKGA